MTDNLFDRLADLFRSSGPVNWRLAREIAASAAGTPEPVDPWLEEEYRDLSATAVRFIDAASPLDAVAAAATPRILDRRSWAAGAADGLAYMAEPLAGKLSGAGGAPEMLQMLAPALIGLQIGGMMGAMSHRVLGEFDLGLPSGTLRSPAYIVPNIEEFADAHELDRRQSRLWVAMQETTHAAVMAVPWVREHAVRSMERFVATLEIDETAIGERMQAMQDPEALQNLVEDGAAIPALLSANGGEAELDDVLTLMAAAEGYAEFLIDRTIADLVPEVLALREAVDRRRAETPPGERMLAQMIGVDLKHVGYRRGTDFCHELARRWGDEAVHRMWERPDSLPQAGDLEDAVAWAARALL